MRRRGESASFLAELDRRLDCGAERRRQIIDEVGEHLRDLVAEARSQGAQSG